MVAERILVVDDEEMNRDLLQRILDRAGYQVTQRFPRYRKPG